jgi:hypothetical protein
VTGFIVTVKLLGLPRLVFFGSGTEDAETSAFDALFTHCMSPLSG